MVLNFGKLTAEEEILKEKINKYKNKKKTLAAQKLPKADNDNQKNSETSTDEQAKILKKLTEIKQEKAKKDKKYKRSKSLKTTTTEPPVSFHRFSQAENENAPAETSTFKAPEPVRKFDLYNNFVASSENKREPQKATKKGNTIFVQAAGIKRESLTSCFERFGEVLNVSMEADKNHAFVTYAQMDSAFEAIKQMNESLLEGVELRVDMARRQPSLDNFRKLPHMEDQTAETPKGPADERNLVKYDDCFS